jgi:hypothetical protein
MKHYPQYINNEKNIHIKKYSETKSRGQTPNPDIEALSPTSPSVANEDNKKIRRLDINDLLAAIMVRMRKNEATFHRKSSPTQETSFYYKDSSVYSSNSKDENSGKLFRFIFGAPKHPFILLTRQANRRLRTQTSTHY